MDDVMLRLGLILGAGDEQGIDDAAESSRDDI